MILSIYFLRNEKKNTVCVRGYTFGTEELKTLCIGIFATMVSIMHVDGMFSMLGCVLVA